MATSPTIDLGKLRLDDGRPGDIEAQPNSKLTNSVGTADADTIQNDRQSTPHLNSQASSIAAPAPRAAVPPKSSLITPSTGSGQPDGVCPALRHASPSLSSQPPLPQDGVCPALRHPSPSLNSQAPLPADGVCPALRHPSPSLSSISSHTSVASDSGHADGTCPALRHPSPSLSSVSSRTSVSEGVHTDPPSPAIPLTTPPLNFQPPPSKEAPSPVSPRGAATLTSPAARAQLEAMRAGARASSSPGPNPGDIRPPPHGAAVGPSRVVRPMGGPMGMRAVGNQPLPSKLPPSLQAKMDAVSGRHRAGTPGGPQVALGGLNPAPAATSMSALLLQQARQGGAGAGGDPHGGSRPAGPNTGPLGLAARRAANRPPMNLGGAASGRPAATAGGLAAARAGMGIAGRRGPPGGLSLAQMGASTQDNRFDDFSRIMQPNGTLKFSKAVLHSGGVDFGDGQSFSINMDEMEILGELGKGNYGSVQKVFHRPTGVAMAMKEIRLELDEARLNSIIVELDILHRAKAPEIVEFYGAFTIESCVYYCMEFMDAGSLDKLTGMGRFPKDRKEVDELPETPVPEDVLRRITASIVRGLRFLKDELSVMHRDVKPTNVLMNTKGEVKLCDFGVSGQLERSLAKTNIGCQSYMAPERIRGESQNQQSTYTVSSDVWSVGLTIIELARGYYPYPPESYSNVLLQLRAIVDGPTPTLPKGYSDEAQDFIAKCLVKDPNGRPTYAQMLEHPWLVKDKETDVDMAGWVASALERQSKRGVTPLEEVEA